jgi:ATP-binding cassette subfamily B (MDR/TAP) protein 1
LLGSVEVSELSSLARNFSKIQEAVISIFRIIGTMSKVDISSKVRMIIDRVEGNI